MKINTRPLFISLIATAVLAAIVTLIQIWTSTFGEDVFFKLLATLGIVGVVASFLIAVEYDLPGTSTKFFLGALVCLSVVSGVLVIGQMWMQILPHDTFINIVLTLLVLAGLNGFVLVAKEDLTSNKRLRDNDYID